MRTTAAVLLLGLVGLVAAQDQSRLDSRYGLSYSADRFPQKTPQEELQSVIRAIETKKIEYLVAHLADPSYVDRAINDYKVAIPKGGDEAKTILAFERLVKEVGKYYVDDPSTVRELRQFAKDAKFETMDNIAIGTVPTIDGRKVFLKKIEGRWFLENKQQ
ncbi:MAG: hypothetical protein HY040_19995 [Planctomycetes bacterium]|nr:hypothetical protein [Planctomycetota bacterium]